MAPLLATTVPQLLSRAERVFGDTEALVDRDVRWSFPQLAAEVSRCAAAMIASGVTPGDRVAVWAGNGHRFVVAALGAVSAGAVLVPVSTRYKSDEASWILARSGTRMLLVDNGFLGNDYLGMLRAAGGVPDELDIVTLGETGDPEAHSFDEFLRRGNVVAAGLVTARGDAVSPHDVSDMFFTSGTTGRPKGAMLAHCNIVHSAMRFCACMDLTAQDRSIAAVPLAHVTGVVANVMTMACCAGTLIIMPEFKAADYLKVAARERVTYTVMVPAMYNLCLLQPDFDACDLSSWRIGGYGGAPMPIATIERLADRIPNLKLMNCYGATETTSPSTIMPGELTAPYIDSVGLPCPGTRILAMDAEGRELPRGEIGELWIGGAQVIKGYWNNPKATAESFTGGFWHSGDLGSIDGDDFVRVFDRQKDMINRGGLKIYSAEVESVLAGHASVVESAIIAKPCPVLGERVHAVIVTRDRVTGDALRAWCAERLSDYKVPETMLLTSEPLPRNANGKVLKRQLRERLAGEVGEPSARTSA